MRRNIEIWFESFDNEQFYLITILDITAPKEDRGFTRWSFYPRRILPYIRPTITSDIITTHVTLYQ